MKILVTGAAGFIGFHLTKVLLKSGHEVIGLDNLNGYYDIKLKFARLKELGILQIDATPLNILCKSEIWAEKFQFIRMNIEDREKLPKLFRRQQFDKVCHLAAQAGVRYSIENPEVYIDTNIVGFGNILECCRHYSIKHLVYASSSSIYGLNDEIPYEVNQKVDTPISLYAASKKSNELMAHTYSHLFKLHTTGLRFFTVYGPWGRPDMAYFLFTDAILKSRPIKIFNNGKLERDFTYIDDIVSGIKSVTETNFNNINEKERLYRIYNIGNNEPIKLLDFIEVIEKYLNTKAKKEYLPNQPGDVERTWASTNELYEDYGYKPKISIEEGIPKFLKWYKRFYY